MSVRFASSRSTLAIVPILAATLLLACNTTSSTDDVPAPGFDVPEGTIVYNGATYTTGSKGARVQESPALLAVEQRLGTTDTVFAVNLGMLPPVSGDYSLEVHSVFPTGKASISVWGANVGSEIDAAARVRVSVYANGDSVQVIGKDLTLSNGTKASFNIRTCTIQSTCPSPRLPR